MNSPERKFLNAANQWICDGYSLDIRYLVRHDLGVPQLWEASLGLQPLAPLKDNDFTIETPMLAVGQRQLQALSARDALAQMRHAVSGHITVDGQLLQLMEVQSFSYYSESMHRDRWYLPLSLHISGNRSSAPSAPDVSLLDSYLRCGNPPFDGLGDVCSWLGLTDHHLSRSGPSINIQVLPPVDLVFEKCRLSDNRLELGIHAMESFDTGTINLAMRAFPGDGLSSRRQIGPEISWDSPNNGLRAGRATLEADSMESALLMLTVGNATIRRQWFVDPAKARNHRLVAVQLFDKDLRMLKQAVLQSADASRFERGIETLLFLLGFAPTVMIERDAPDLIVATPSGRLILVECTTRIADFHTKLGKLIDRRGAAIKVMQTSGHGSMVFAALVCALPRTQIAISDAELAKHRVLLVTAEALATVLHQTWFPGDPDKLLDDGLATTGAVRAGEEGSPNEQHP